jgi:peptidyl-prolyl cis-trans isomerase SurA
VLGVALLAAHGALGQRPLRPLPPAAQVADAASARIVAVVNGDVISAQDVDNRRRLFALSTGLPMAPDVLQNLTPQIIKQLIDEKLRLQEIERRRIAVSDQDIAHAIGEIEHRNNMPAGALRQKLQADGVAMRTLVDQIRVQLGWARVLHQLMGPRTQIGAADIADREAELKAETGQPEYEVGEIFIPVEGARAAGEAGKFAETVIGELREGAPFPVAAAQFSQSQTALQGGDLGWVQADSLDPEVLRVLNEMPVGAISNPIPVPGGIDIVTLRGKRLVGTDTGTVFRVRQAFYPFSTPLNPQAPTAQQKQALDSARRLSASAADCNAIEAANAQAGAARPSDPGPVDPANMPPQMRAVFDRLPPGKASLPLVAQDGILVLMVCSVEHPVAGLPSREELATRILDERVERGSRQLMRELDRRATIEQRS